MSSASAGLLKYVLKSVMILGAGHEVMGHGSSILSSPDGPSWRSSKGLNCWPWAMLRYLTLAKSSILRFTQEETNSFVMYSVPFLFSNLDMDSISAQDEPLSSYIFVKVG